MTGNRYFQNYNEPAAPLPASNLLFKELEILKIDDIYKLNIANFIYSSLAGLTPDIFLDYFVLNHAVHDHATTSNTVIVQNSYFDPGYQVNTNSLHTQNSNLVNYGARLLKVFGPVLWNSLPLQIRESSSIKSFKFHLKHYFLDQYEN